MNIKTNLVIRPVIYCWNLLIIVFVQNLSGFHHLKFLASKKKSMILFLRYFYACGGLISIVLRIIIIIIY